MIEQITHERQVSDFISASAVASVAHPEENSFSSPNVIMQANSVNTTSEQNPTVSY